MVVIGITGPTGAGKTTALNELEKLGGAVIDCDAVYHEMLESDITLQDMLVQAFGDIRNENHGIDRKKLGAIVFNDPEALEQLNGIVRTAITRAISELLDGYRAAGTYRAAAIDGISIFETGLDRLCDTTLAIVAPAEIRIRRIMAREGISEEYARARVKAQNPDEFYTSRCAHTLVNDCADRESFGVRSRELLERII